MAPQAYDAPRETRRHPTRHPGSQFPKEHSVSEKRQKPAKLRPNFPLFPHQNGQWAKKIRQKFYYFGPWEDPIAAKKKYLDEREYLQAGRTPPQSSDGCRVRDLVNRFLTVKEAMRVRRTFWKIVSGLFQSLRKAGGAFWPGTAG